MFMNNDSVIARRKLLQLGAVALGTGVATKVLDSSAKKAQAQATKVALQNLDQSATPDEVLEELVAGNKRFIENRPEAPNQDFIRLREVSTGQKPLVSILSCADSRVPVEIVFDRGLGDLFVVRDAGNIATPEEIGSLEYGTAILGSKILMVLGHESCGAVKAALDGKPLPGQIATIVAAIQPSIDRENQNNSQEFYTKTIKQNVLLQIQKLNSSSLLHNLVREGKLKIVGAYYSLKTGKVEILT